jgi:hypothetical protein
MKSPLSQIAFTRAPSIIRIIKSRRMRLAKRVARMEGRGILGYWWETTRKETARKTKTYKALTCLLTYSWS